MADKQLDLAAGIGGELSTQLVADALENVVSAFDGFGREICRVYAAKATNPSKAQDISFQNLSGAQKNVETFFGFDLAGGFDAHEWATACRFFQQRHLLAHRMGVVDEVYVKKSGDTRAMIGRKVTIVPDEVRVMVQLIGKLGLWLNDELGRIP